MVFIVMAETTMNWWDRFIEALENPDIQTYDFISSSINGYLDENNIDSADDVLRAFYHKGYQEIRELRDLKELQKTIQGLENKKFFFPDPRVRTTMKLVRIALETYVDAQEQYAKQLDRGPVIPIPAADVKKEIDDLAEKILQEDFEEGTLRKNIEEIHAVHVTEDSAKVKETIDSAITELKKQSKLASLADNTVGVSKHLLKPDNLAAIAIHALPIITWKYRWGLALGLGVYSSRLCVYHGAKALKKAVYDKDMPQARIEAGEAVSALKAAGGNVIAIGLSPLFGKLPKAIAGYASFMVPKIYDKTVGAVVRKLKTPDIDETKPDLSIESVFNRVRSFYENNEGPLVRNTIKATKGMIPESITKVFDRVTKHVDPSDILKETIRLGRACGMAASHTCKDILNSVDYDHRFHMSEPEKVWARNKDYHSVVHNNHFILSPWPP